MFHHVPELLNKLQYTSIHLPAIDPVAKISPFSSHTKVLSIEDVSFFQKNFNSIEPQELLPLGQIAF